MKTLALALWVAGAAAAQESKPALQPTDAQASELGAFVSDKVDSNASAEDLDRAILEKIDALQKGTTVEKKEEPAPARGKKKNGAKKAGKKASKKGSNAQSPDTIKNGMTESDRVAFGKFVATEISAEHKGQALADAVKKELARLREGRVKASSTADAAPKKKKKKGAN